MKRPRLSWNLVEFLLTAAIVVASACLIVTELRRAQGADRVVPGSVAAVTTPCPHDEPIDSDTDLPIHPSDRPTRPVVTHGHDAQHPGAPPPPFQPPPLVFPRVVAPPLPPPLVVPPPPRRPRIVFYGREVEEADAIYFVLDFSDSMTWYEGSYVDEEGRTVRGTRLDRARAEFRRAITAIPDGPFVGAMAYDCSARAWNEGVMVKSTPESRAAAVAWVDGLRPPYGATGTWRAISQACWQAPKVKTMRIVLLTDGAPNCGSDPLQHRREIRAANVLSAPKKGCVASIDVFAIGASGEMREFCGWVASDNGGSVTDVAF